MSPLGPAIQELLCPCVPLGHIRCHVFGLAVCGLGCCKTVAGIQNTPCWYAGEQKKETRSDWDSSSGNIPVPVLLCGVVTCVTAAIAMVGTCICGNVCFQPLPVCCGSPKVMPAGETVHCVEPHALPNWCLFLRIQTFSWPSPDSKL